MFESTVDNLIDDPRVGGILVSSRDVTDEEARQVALRNAAYTDPLTGLPNRAAIDKALREIADAGDEQVAVAFVGIERLQLVRQSLGHSTADAVVRIIANRCRTSVPATQMVGQIGIDTFVLVITDGAVDHAQEMLWRIVQRISEPIFIDGHELLLSASAGLVVSGTRSTAEALLDDSALALHHATTHGGGRVALFDPSLRRQATARLEIEANLRHAFANDDLWIALQPIVSLPDATPVRAEVLLRWDLNGTPVPPEEFIGVAEETGLIVPIGDRVIDRAARVAARAPGGQVFVNLSPQQLASRDSSNGSNASSKAAKSPRSRSASRSPRRSSSSTSTSPRRSCSASAASGAPSVSMTSGPATPPSATCESCRSTSSRSTEPSPVTSTRITRLARSSVPSSIWPVPSTSASSPNASKPPPKPRRSSSSAARTPRGTCSGRPPERSRSPRRRLLSGARHGELTVPPR